MPRPLLIRAPVAAPSTMSAVMAKSQILPGAASLGSSCFRLVGFFARFNGQKTVGLGSMVLTNAVVSLSLSLDQGRTSIALSKAGHDATPVPNQGRVLPIAGPAQNQRVFTREKYLHATCFVGMFDTGVESTTQVSCSVPQIRTICSSGARLFRGEAGGIRSGNEAGDEPGDRELRRLKELDGVSPCRVQTGGEDCCQKTSSGMRPRTRQLRLAKSRVTNAIPRAEAWALWSAFVRRRGITVTHSAGCPFT
jgi:hypothetical protein